MASTRPLVLLTGPNGFVGAHVLDQLLQSGYRVRGTVRSPAKCSFLEEKYTTQMANNELSFTIVPDIQAPHALDVAMSDVDFACHVASPYFTTSEDPLKELIEPAVNGTKNVLSSALKSNTLKRLTIMSSFAAVIDPSKSRRPGYTYTSADWNPITLEEGVKNGYLGYFASKTLAERAAWDMWKEAKPAWDLVTFCAPMIYGPPLHELDPGKGIAGLNTSLKRLMSAITGQDPAYAPKVATFGMPAWVDVRDVADAHVKSLVLAKGMSERFTLCSGTDNFEDGLAGLRAKGEKGLGEEGERVDRSEFYSIDRSKAENLLKIEFIPFQETVEDVWASMKKILSGTNSIVMTAPSIGVGGHVWETKTYQGVPDSGMKMTLSFCGNCGTVISKLASANVFDGDFIDFAGTLDDEDALDKTRPDTELFTELRVQGWGEVEGARQVKEFSLIFWGIE